MRSGERDNDPSMVGRVMAVLGALSGDERSLGVSELARRTGIPKASTSRIVAELVAHGLLERSAHGVSLGIRLFELGERASRPRDLKRLTLPHMADLRIGTGQTVHLAVLDGYEVVYIQILRSKDAPRLPSRIGGRLPAYATGVGKALLAQMPAAQVDAHLPPVLARLGPRTITDRGVLDAALARIREAGVAYEQEESAPGVGCAAAPILDGAGEAIAAMSVTIRLERANLATLGAAVATAASAASREMARQRFMVVQPPLSHP